MEAVKGAVFALLIDAYQKRDQVALVTFRGRGAQVLLPPTPSVERAHRYLKKLPSGGRTPLSMGLVKTFDLAKASARKDSRLSPIVVVLSDGRVTHCCYDYDGAQAIGDLKTQTVREILSSNRIPELMEAFRARDFETLPRCGECYKNTSGKAVVVDQLIRIGHKLDRVLPVKQVARKIINR